MKIDKKLHELGGKFSYQYFCLLTTFFFWYASDVFYMSMTFLEKNPDFLCLNPSDNSYTVDCSLEQVCKGYDIGQQIPHMFKPGYVDSWTAEFRLYCNESLVSLLGMIYFVGLTFGIITFPFLCDTIGRKKLIIVFGTILAISSFIVPFINSVYLLYIFLPIIGFCQPIQEATLLLLIEKTSIGHRPIFSGIVVAGDGLAGIVIALLMNVFNSWRLNFFITTAISIVNTLVYYFFLVESPHFLYVQKKKEELKETFNYIAAFNEIEIEDDMLSISDSSEHLLSDGGTPQVIEFRPYSSFFTYKSLFITIFVMAFLWFIESCMYSGVILFNKNFKDVYLVTIIGWTIDIITGLISGPIINIEYLGRKKSVLCFYVLNIFFCFAFHFGSAFDFSEKILILLDSGARVAYNTIYVILFVYTSELFPTVVRSKAICICSTIKGLGGIFGSYVVEFFPRELFLLFSIFSVMAFFFVCFLEETFEKPLSHDIREIEEEKLARSLQRE